MKTNYMVKQFVAALLFFAIIFVGAGTINYWQGLVYVAIGIIMLLLNYTVFQIDPQLMKERSKPGEGTKKWDKTILGLSFLSMLSMYIVAGMDSGRFHWSPQFHWSVYLLGILLTVSGQFLFLIAQKQNKFFSSTVRIQTERGHVVCDKGLYSFVRHPAYLGSIIQTIGFPLLFGSMWSILPITVLIILLITRTYLEDRTLKNELSGYVAYSDKVQYRIIPYIW